MTHHNTRMRPVVHPADLSKHSYVVEEILDHQFEDVSILSYGSLATRPQLTL